MSAIILLLATPLVVVAFVAGIYYQTGYLPYFEDGKIVWRRP